MKGSIHKKGSTLFIAITVSTIVTALALGLLAIMTKEVRFSSLIRESQSALTAADSGIECALLWDLIHEGYTQSYFASSSDAVAAGLGGPPDFNFCAGQQYIPLTFDVNGSGGMDIEWDVVAPNGAGAATTTFWFSTWSAEFNGTPSRVNPCVKVEVGKYIEVIGPYNVPRTNIRAEGFNTCLSDRSRKVSRGVEITY